MDIKKRIQELSLDQKAKLYFMGLVRQGKIDTLPEDPKAAYVSMMMDKDDYGRSISGKDKRTFMEPKDSMPAARAKKMAQTAYDKAEMDGDIRGMELALAAMDIDKPIPGLNEMQMVNKKTGEDVTKYVLQLLQGEISKEEFEKITGLKKEPIDEPEDLNLEPEEEDSYRDMIQGKYSDDDLRLEPELDEDRDEEDEENDRNLAVDDIPDSLREIATELGYLNEEDRFAGFADKPTDKKDYLGKNLDKLKRSVKNPISKDPELNKNKSKVDISYTDPGFRFYKMKVDGKRLNREEGTKYLKDLGIDMEIPRTYETNKLDKIVKSLKEKGIDADHNAAMDVS